MRCYAEVVECGALNPLIVVVRDANKNANIASHLKIEHQSGVLDRFPCRLEKQPMLRIHIRCFTRRDSKKLWVKLVDLVQEAAPLRKSFSSNSWLGIIIPLHIPAVCRHIDDGIAAFDQQFPESLCVIDSAGKAAANSNDGDTVFVHKADGARDAAAAILKQFPSMATS